LATDLGEPAWEPPWAAALAGERLDIRFLFLQCCRVQIFFALDVYVDAFLRVLNCSTMNCIIRLNKKIIATLVIKTLFVHSAFLTLNLVVCSGSQPFWNGY
jgi:hypothetical protein